MPNITFIICAGCQFSAVSGLIDCFNIANRRYAMSTGQRAAPLFTTRIVSRNMKTVQVGGGFQTSYSIFNAHKSHGDKEILKAQELIETNFAAALKMEDIAGQLGISPRHFIRRFKAATGETPLRYLQQIRIDKAKGLLETTLETINEIAKYIGYENDSSFRKLFKEATGLSPSNYRSQFNLGGGAAKQSRLAS